MKSQFQSDFTNNFFTRVGSGILEKGTSDSIAHIRNVGTLVKKIDAFSAEKYGVTRLKVALFSADFSCALFFSADF